MVVALDEALARADDLLAHGAPFEDILAALDACLELPGSDDARPGIEHRRLAAYRIYGRSEMEVEQALLAFHSVEPEPVRLASATLATCARYPGIAARHLGPLLAELEAAVGTNAALANVLQSAYEVRQRLGLG